MSKTAEECNNWLDQILHEKHREHQFDMMNSALGQARIEGAEAMLNHIVNGIDINKGLASIDQISPTEVVEGLEAKP